MTRAEMAKRINEVTEWRLRKNALRCKCEASDVYVCTSWHKDKDTGDIEPCSCKCHTKE